MENKPRLLKAIGIVLVIGAIVVRTLGHRLNSSPLPGCLVVGGLLFAISLVAFIFGALPYRATGAKDKATARAFIFACFSLAFSAVQIPLWTYMTKQFPPGTMSHSQADWATASVTISLIGPAAPWVVSYLRLLRARDKEQREALSQKKQERD